MALINCPECGREISDKAEKCVNCGYPIKTQSYIENINGKNIDVSFLLNPHVVRGKKINTLLELSELPTSKENLDKIILIVNKYSPLEDGKQQSTQPNLPKCPRCGSTSITAGQRGYSIMWGFLGSGNTVNRCANCGHKWKP